MIIDRKPQATTGATPTAHTDYRNEAKPGADTDQLRKLSGTPSAPQAVSDWNALGKPTPPRR